MITATRYHDISCGHRVVGQGGKCEKLHGHNYRIHFTVQYQDDCEVDEVGRVIDFSVIKTVLCQWLELNWDHKMLLWDQDPMVSALDCILRDGDFLCVPFNPTAENMAMHLVRWVAPREFRAIGQSACVLIKCIVEETRKCSATYEIEEKDYKNFPEPLPKNNKVDYDDLPF